MAASIMTCSSLTSSLAITCLRAAISFFSPIRRMELERASARMVVSSERRFRLLMPPELVSSAALGVSRVLPLLLELREGVLLRVVLLLLLLRLLADVRELLPLLDDPPVMSEFRVPDSSSASAYSRLMTSKMVSGSTMTSSTSIIFSKKGKFSAWEKMMMILVRSSASTLTSPCMSTALPPSVFAIEACVGALGVAGLALARITPDGVRAYGFPTGSGLFSSPFAAVMISSILAAISTASA